jgi:hypothetical protein
MKKKKELYDAFETRKDAINVAKGMDSFFGQKAVRKLKGKQRLQYGVYVGRY